MTEAEKRKAHNQMLVDRVKGIPAKDEKVPAEESVNQTPMRPMRTTNGND